MNKELRHHWLNVDCEKTGGQKPWRVTAFSEMYKICLPDGQTPLERRINSQFDGPIIPLGSRSTFSAIS